MSGQGDRTVWSLSESRLRLLIAIRALIFGVDGHIRMRPESRCEMSPRRTCGVCGS